MRIFCPLLSTDCVKSIQIPGLMYLIPLQLHCCLKTIINMSVSLIVAQADMLLHYYSDIHTQCFFITY